MPKKQLAHHVNAAEAARLLGVSRQHISALVAIGRLPGIRQGKYVYIPRDAVANWYSGKNDRRTGQKRSRAFWKTVCLTEKSATTLARELGVSVQTIQYHRHKLKTTV